MWKKQTINWSRASNGSDKKEQAFRGYDGCSLSTPIYRTRADQKNGKLLHRVCRGILFFFFFFQLFSFWVDRMLVLLLMLLLTTNKKIFNVATEHWMWIYRCDGAHENGNMYNIIIYCRVDLEKWCDHVIKVSMHSTKWSPEGPERTAREWEPMKPKMYFKCVCIRYVPAHAPIYIVGAFVQSTGTNQLCCVTHDIAVVSQQLLL